MKPIAPEVEREIVRRLALAIPATPYGRLDAMAVSGILGNIGADADCNELGTVVAMGVLSTATRGPSVNDCTAYSAADVLRFLETHGEAWFLARLEVTKAALRERARVEQPDGANSADSDDETPRDVAA